MDKNKAMFVSRKIFDYLCKICGYEHPDNIGIIVVDDENNEENATTYIDPIYLAGHILLNIHEIETVDELIEVICHEVVHVFTAEYLGFFNVWHKFNTKSIHTPQFKTFSIAHEKTANRIGILLKHIISNKIKDEPNWIKN